MQTIHETLPPTRRLELAVRVSTPTRLARTFAEFVGQFYDRQDFDLLARRVSELYDPARASTFRAQLDRRLYDRYHGAVAWEVAPQPTQTPAA
jgi:hypothetical protein